MTHYLQHPGRFENPAMGEFKDVWANDGASLSWNRNTHFNAGDMVRRSYNMKGIHGYNLKKKPIGMYFTNRIYVDIYIYIIQYILIILVGGFNPSEKY